MEKSAARAMVKNALENPFDKGRFGELARNILYDFDDSDSVRFINTGGLIPRAFAGTISALERLGKYTDADGKSVDILRILLKKDTSLERARTAQRNFVARYLNGSRGNELRDAALVAFVAPDEDDWRFSFVKMEYRIDENGKVKEGFTPARRYSFLVGEHENSHTAQSRLMSLLTRKEKPVLEKLEEAFSVEPVTDGFFEQYEGLYKRLKKALDKIVKDGGAIKRDFDEKKIDTGDFVKKLLGQIVFLYFLQKKGWLRVKHADLGDGHKNFLRTLFTRERSGNKTFFNDVLERLFYKALRDDKRPKDEYLGEFGCKIPFLNGGLFDPMENYDWESIRIPLADKLFSNTKTTKAGDIGDGILDVFDRYNFTVAEDEPLEKEVAVDPEMLGKVFEKLLKDRGATGTYYTPREIVHYMCRESLTNYLVTELGCAVDEADIETLIQYGGNVAEHDSHVTNKGVESNRYSFKLPEAVRKNAKTIDAKLASIRVCDPAVGSGAFLVGMMTEIVRTRTALTSYIADKTKRAPYHFKFHAIKYSLYGVDIAAGATDIAKLRLWLSLIVDEDDRAAIKPLPNLDYKVMCGNSLLKVRKLLNFKPLNKLEDLRARQFVETNTAKKDRYKEQIDALATEISGSTDEFDLRVHFSEMFPADAARSEDGGFHVVVANPPYVKKEHLDQKTIDHLEQHFSEVKKGKTKSWSDDLYAHFIFRGIDFARNSGVVTYITNDSFIGLTNKARVRRLLMQYDLRKIIRCPAETFDAMIYTAVFVLRKSATQKRAYKSGHFTYPQFACEMAGSVSFDTIATLPNNRFISASPVLGVYEKLANLERVKNHIQVLDTGIDTGNVRNKIFFKQKDRDGLHRLLQGRQIGRWLIVWDAAKAKYKYCDINYVSKNRKGIGRKGKPSNSNEYWKFRGNIENHHQPERLLMRQSDDDLLVAYHSEAEHGKYYTDNTLFTILPKSAGVSLKYAMALLNSTLLNVLYQFLSQEEGKTLAQIKAGLVKEMPFCVGNQIPVVSLVDKILAITNAANYMQNTAKQSKVRAYEKQIDELVYKLYDLTPAEIAIIENHQNK